MAVEVSDAPEESRYEARLDGAEEVAGYAVYSRTPEVITFVHTEVGEAYGGRGIGSALVRHSLDEAREQGLRVVAACAFYAGWIAKHPEYADLLQ
ncbi:GNAT family N-acetyltransferase [Streptomyces sp. YIM 98790]|uniref:GNAT family N-acetyltransferase n=1 Tax=Streptomyces sp. YIM 98790 TaxID=2689077 RepID=UPI00140A3324|nr:GNAT family N-acetyltransferase [Streptomyces sp. YIM 98790]